MQGAQPFEMNALGETGPETGPATEPAEDFVQGGGVRLHLRRHRATPGPRAAARLLVLHGYGDHAGRYAHVMRWLSARGVDSVAVDLRGHGLSGGRRGYVRRWDEYLDDVRAALAHGRHVWAAEGLSRLPLFVLGHSHGGLVLAAAVIRGILRPAEVAGCVMSAPWLAAAEPLTWAWRAIAVATNVVAPALRVRTGLTPDMMTSDPQMIADSRADPLLLRSATPRWFATAVRAQADVAARAAEFRLPLLCLIGDHDRIASLHAARRFVDHAGSADKAFEVLPGARHEILRETGRERTFERIMGWMADRAVGPQRL